MPTTTTNVNGRFALEVDGVHVGTVKKFSGLGAQASIAVSNTGVSNATKKNVSGVQWTPGRATVGLGMGKGLYGWLRASMQGGKLARNGVFQSADFNFKVRHVLNFNQALITEFTVPRLDAASKEAGAFDIAFMVEQLNWLAGKGETLNNTIEPKPKAWTVSNFRIAIGTLPCTRVTAVESFTWSASVQAATVGNTRPGELQQARITVPDLQLTIAGADYAAWAEAARKWFVEGKRAEADEMAGRITLLGLNLVDELATIELSNIGFKSFTHPDAAANSAQTEHFKVELYAEKMLLVIKELEA